MIYVINQLSDPFINVIKDDPVRPDISAEQRVGPNKEILVEMQNGKPAAAVCVCYQNFVPSSVAELNACDDYTVAVFYTIWSYQPGAGRRLVFLARDYILENRKAVQRFVTLSPQTEMARKFHIQNGAFELRVNTDTVNYEYV